MGKESQGSRETTHARIYKDQKKRVQRIAHARALKQDQNVTDINVLSEILERELPKEERKLGLEKV